MPVFLGDKLRFALLLLAQCFINHPPDSEVREFLEVHSPGVDIEVMEKTGELGFRPFLPRDGLVLNAHICSRDFHVIRVKVRDHLVVYAGVDSRKPNQLIVFAGKIFDTFDELPCMLHAEGK